MRVEASGRRWDILNFIYGVPEWRSRDFELPLWSLLAALKDLNEGRVASLISPTPQHRLKRCNGPHGTIVRELNERLAQSHLKLLETVSRLRLRFSLATFL